MLRQPCRRLQPAISLAAVALAAQPAVRADPAAQLVAEFSFSDLKSGPAGFVANAVNGKPCVLRGGSGGEGVEGPGLRLSGAADEVLDLGVLGFNQPATIALWIKRAAAPTADPNGASRPEYLQEHDRGQGRLLSRTGGQPSHVLAGSLRVGPNGLQLWNGPGWVTLISAPIPAETWVHLAVVFDEQHQAIGYLNGRPSGTAKSGFDGEPLALGLFAASHDRHYGYPFAGGVDEVRIYRGALGPAAVAALAVRSGSGGPARADP